MALSSLSGRLSSVFQANAQQAVTGYNPLTSGQSVNKQLQMTTSVNTNAAGGADEAFLFRTAIVAGGSATIDLTAMTNLISQTASIVRAKGVQFRLLSASDAPDISPAPNANSVMCLLNYGVANPSPWFFSNGGSGLTLNITNNAGVVNVATINVAGANYPKSATFLATVNHVNGSGLAVSINTNSGGVPTAATIVNGGASYINSANTQTSILGQAQINTGGFLPYGDPTAAGFLSISATAKNIKVVNNDSVNAITVELGLFGGTT